MDNNGFDNFDGFGADGDFGFNDSDSIFSDSSTDFGSDSSTDFGSDSMFNDSSNDNNTDDSDNQFSGVLDNMDNQNNFEDNASEQGSVKKTSLIMIAVGVIAIIGVVLIAGAVSRSKNKTNIETGQQASQDSNSTSGSNKDSVMSNNTNENTNNNVITNKVDNEFTWTIITNSENVQFNDEYSDMIFTVTKIEHKARVVDTNNNLVIKTTIQGSISGLPGTYELDIPYDKGIKLVVGDNFTVHVKLGTYNEKTVVGEIQY